LERLVSSSEAAQILNLSVQGIHYRIKKGQLKSTKQNGRVFVYINESLIKSKQQNETTQKHRQIPNELIDVKNEQITLLKKSIKWMRQQYQSEIERLERNQQQIIKVFKSEIALLQSAFNEMRKIYKVENKLAKKKTETENFKLMEIKDFFIFMKKHNKSNREIKSIILNAVKRGDKRFIFNRNTKEVMIYKSDFLDLL
jgi:HAMP domain-containing protein